MHKFIRIKGERAKTIGFYVPRLYHLNFDWWTLRRFGLRYLRDRLSGWHIWWVENEEDLKTALDGLHELQKTNIFKIQVSE